MGLPTMTRTTQYLYVFRSLVPLIPVYVMPNQVLGGSALLAHQCKLVVAIIAYVQVTIFRARSGCSADVADARLPFVSAAAGAASLTIHPGVGGFKLSPTNRANLGLRRSVLF